MIDIDDIINILPQYRNLLMDYLGSQSFTVNLKDEPDTTNKQCLFIATYSDDEHWYGRPFDRNFYIKKLYKTKKWIFITDDLRNKNIAENIIYVFSIFDFLEQLLIRSREKKEYKIIAVTGSVGKTTLCRLLHFLLENSVLIPSKRLTPLVIYDFFINHLDKSINYIIAEVGLFYKNQVDSLSKMLRPTIGVLLNIFDMHMQWNGISDRKDLLMEKVKLLTYSTVPIMPYVLYTEYQRELSMLPVTTVFKTNEFIERYRNIYSIFPNTSTTENQFEVLAKIEYAINQNFTKNDVKSFICNLRLKILKQNSSIIYFDMHCSLAGYFQAFSEHSYENINLFISSFNFINEDPIMNISLITKTFNYYKKVYINNKLRAYFNGQLLSNVTFIKINRFPLLYSNTKYSFVHDPLLYSGNGEKMYD